MELTEREGSYNIRKKIEKGWIHGNRKTLYKHNVLLSVATGIVICLSIRGEVTFNGPSDAMGVTSLTNAVRWSDGNLPEDPTVDYRIASGILRTPNYSDYVFKGKSLTIGSTNSTQTAGLAICTWDTAGVRTVEFQNDGLILESGILSQYNDRGTKIAGKITVAAPVSKDFCSGNNQKAYQSGMDGAGLWFTGEVVGEAGTRWRFQRSYYGQSNCTATNSTFRFTGDLSNCRSTFVFRPYAEESAPADTNRITFSIGVPSFPGTLELWAQAGLEPYYVNTDLTLGTLICKAGSSILCRYDTAAGDGCTITVTDALTVQRPVRVTTAITGTGKAAIRHPLLKAPSGATLDANDFVFAGGADAAGFSLAVAPDGNGLSTLWVTRGPVIELAKADAFNERESFRKSATSSITNGWENLAYPGPGTNYVVENKTLRSPDQVKVNGTNVRGFAFEGDSLTLKNGAVLAVRSYALTNDNLYCVAASGDVTISHYNYGSSALFPWSKAGTCIFAGRCTFSSSGNKWILLSLSTDRSFRYDADFAGNANVRVQAYCEATQKNPPNGHHWFTSINTNLRGKVRFCYSANNTWTGGDSSIAVPSMDYCNRVYCTDPRNFGGPLAAFDRQAMQIEDYSIIHPMNDVVFDDPTRGWAICNELGGGAAVGRFDVTNGVTMTFKQQLNFNANYATLVKEGAGTLELGDFQPTFWSGGNPDPTALYSNNMFRVVRGTVKALTGKVFNGLQVFFAPETKLAFDADPRDETLATYGLLNDIYRSGRTDRTGTNQYLGKPVSLIDGATQLAVEIQAGESAVAPKYLPLFTVGTEHATTLAGLLKVTHPFSRVQATIVSSEPFAAPNKGGTLTTIGVAFDRGMCIIIR